MEKIKQTNSPLVSVRVVTYNQKSFIKECIESVLAQDYKSFEIVVSDDGSTDGTQEVLKEYKNKYPDVFKLALSDTNRGVTKNINSGLRLCEGKYIAGLGGDDLMLPGKLSKQVEYMELNPDCTICYHNLDVFDSKTNKTIRFFNSKNKISGGLKESIKYGTFNGACSNLIRASKMPKSGFNENLPVAADWLCWVETLANGGTIDYIDEVLGRYRIHENNVTRKEDFITQGEIDHLASCQIILAKYPDFFDEVMYSYSRKLLSLRRKVNYFDAVFKSFCIKPSLNNMAAIIMYFITAGKVKL